jgi:hypothetical protein
METKINEQDKAGEADRGILTSLPFLQLLVILAIVPPFLFGPVGLFISLLSFSYLTVLFGYYSIVAFRSAFNALRQNRNKKTWQEIGSKVIDVVGFTLTGAFNLSMAVAAIAGFLAIYSCR